MPKIFICLMLSLFVTACFNDNHSSNQQSTDSPTNTQKPQNDNNQAKPIASFDKANLDSKKCDNQTIYQAYKQKNENKAVQTIGCGTVSKILKDDNKGSRHQRFVVQLDGYPDITVLIAHNIDLAPRVKDIKQQTPIQFYGEYIYNRQGGVMHWTHKDPNKRHADGWIKYQGERYW